MRTGFSTESIRRYRRGDRPPLDFVAALAATLGYSLNWLLTGRGPSRREEMLRQAAAQATPVAILREITRRAAQVQGAADRPLSLV